MAPAPASRFHTVEAAGARYNRAMSKHIFKNSGAHLPETCRPAAEVVARLGDKWTFPVLGQLFGGRKRFSALQSAIGGISQRMLTLTLRSLERDGLVARIVHPSVPPRVEYELTPLGRSLIGSMAGLAEWAEANFPDIDAARRRFDTGGTSGA